MGLITKKEEVDDAPYRKVNNGETEYEFPIVEGTEGESAITFIDGEQGILRYRGVPIEQFEQHPNFGEVAWLLIFGRLPTEEEYRSFSTDLTEHANIDEAMKHHFEGFPRSAPPMAILSAMINTLDFVKYGWLFFSIGEKG